MDFGLLMHRHSQVFPNSSNDDDNQDIRDMEGPTMRERMQQERMARMTQGGPPTSS